MASNPLTLDEGKALVKYARSIIASYFSGGKAELPDALRGKDFFTEKRGVFVTLEKYPGHELRGCIGYSEPIMPLGKAVEYVALSAALRDPRFHPLAERELRDIVVEVSVLTKPEIIKAADPRKYVEEVVVGRDGLIVERGFYKGLLLPQVPVEWKWDTEEFLSQTCMKAGLSPDEWLNPKTKICRFSAQIFSEIKPEGDVVEKDISRR